MSNRHKLATECDGIQDLKRLAILLTAAVTECETEGVIPSTDPAVMVICYQIAFAGNGDSEIPGYYRRLYNFCAQNRDQTVLQGMNFEHGGKPN